MSWSALRDVEEVTVSPGVPWQTCPELDLPGSKSQTNRALLIAALARGHSVLSGLLRSDDSHWCVEALRALGAGVIVEGDTARVEGVDGRWPNRTGTVYVGSAGTVARFLPAALALDAGGVWTIDASAQMRSRPMRPLFEALAAQGAHCSFLGDEGALPVRLSSHGLAGGSLAMSGRVSSQFLSGLLIAGPYARQPLAISVLDHIVQPSYVRLTLNAMATFGIQARSSEDLLQVSVPNGRYVARDVTLEPDVSTACYFMALAALTGQKLRLRGVRPQTDQPDIAMLPMLERMGCRVRTDPGFVEIDGPERLRGGFTADMRAMSDQAPTLAVLSVFADAPVSIGGVEHIRSHESDRITAICQSLSRLGVAVEERRDGLTVNPGPVMPTLLESFDDHRMAMSLSLIGAVVPGVKIKDPGCVSKTFPDFYARLASLGLDVVFGRP